MRLILYRRSSCHLCELAEQALLAAGADTFERVEIGWEGELSEIYGWRIPVLRVEPDGRELDWPFDSFSARRFLDAREA